MRSTWNTRGHSMPLSNEDLALALQTGDVTETRVRKLLRHTSAPDRLTAILDLLPEPQQQATRDLLVFLRKIPA